MRDNADNWIKVKSCKTCPQFAGNYGSSTCHEGGLKPMYAWLNLEPRQIANAGRVVLRLVTRPKSSSKHIETTRNSNAQKPLKRTN